MIEQSWSADTTYNPEEWSVDNPARGQCVPTALVVQHYLGGELQRLVTDYHGREESHYRNILPGGQIVDLARQQYPPEQELSIKEVALKGFDSIRAKHQADSFTQKRYERLLAAVEAKLA